jgi:hypothetical protein
VGVQVHASTDLAPGEKPAVSNEYEAEWAGEPIWTMCRGQNLFLLSVGYSQTKRRRKKKIPTQLPRISAPFKINSCLRFLFSGLKIFHVNVHELASPKKKIFIFIWLCVCSVSQLERKRTVRWLTFIDIRRIHVPNFVRMTYKNGEIGTSGPVIQILI